MGKKSIKIEKRSIIPSRHSPNCPFISWAILGESMDRLRILWIQAMAEKSTNEIDKTTNEIDNFPFETQKTDE